MKFQKFWFAGLLVISLSGCSGFSNSVKMTEEANNYAVSSAKLICMVWNEEALRREASPALTTALNSNAPAVKKAFADGADKLGGLQSCETPVLKKFKDAIELDGEHVRVTLETKAKFAKGEGTITEVVNKHNGEWKLDGFYVNSPLLQ